MGITLAAAKLMGEPFACQLSEYMRTIIYKVPGLLVQEGRLPPISVEHASDFNVSIVTDPISYLKDSNFSDQYKLDMNFRAELLDECANDRKDSGKDIFVTIQLKENMGSFQAVDGQCIKIKHDDIEELAIVDCDDAPAPHPKQRENSVNRVLAAARAGLGVTGEFETILDRSCYRTDYGQCVYGLRVQVRANLEVVNPLTLEDLTVRSEAVKELAAKIQEDIEADHTGGASQPVIVPKVFLSYSWDSEAHKQWVKELASRLRGDGLDVSLDQWEAVLGDQLPSFMEKAIGESRYVLIVCTPNYKERSEGRIGGVGYEGDIITAEIMAAQNHRKFIPVLRCGKWEDAAPSWLSGKCYCDLSDDHSEGQYQQLVLTLHGKLEPPPPIGEPMSSFR